MPLVSVVINVRNGARFLPAALASLEAQSYRDFEVVVVDDASEDETPTILRSFRGAPLRILRNERRLGIPRSANRGLAAASGKWVARLDADDLAYPERLARQVAEFERRPELALLGSAADFVDETGRAFGFCDVATGHDELIRRLSIDNPLVHSTVAFERAAVLALGGYCEDLDLAIDYELWLRFAERFRLGALAEPLAGYRIHSEQISLQALRAQRRDVDRGRRSALERRRRLGLPLNGLTAVRPPWHRRLRGGPGCFGGDVDFWCGLFAAMGRNGRARRFALTGLPFAPLSSALWHFVLFGRRRHGA